MNHRYFKCFQGNRLLIIPFEKVAAVMSKDNCCKVYVGSGEDETAFFLDEQNTPSFLAYYTTWLDGKEADECDSE
jgi:hypothetical protein